MDQLQLLDDEELVEDVKYSVRHLWNFSTGYYGITPPPFRVPCTNPCSIMRAQLPLLQTQEYKVGEKTDGVRMYLLCSFIMRAKQDDDEEEEYGVLLDRAGHMYRIQVRGVGDLFAGTLLDGELCAHGDTLSYIVFDAVACNGYSVVTQTHTVRLETARLMLESMTIAGVQVSVKCWHPLHDAVHVFRAADPAHCDGLILVPETRPLQHGTQHDLFKWKPGHSHTVDLVFNGKYLYAWGENGQLGVIPDLADCVWEVPLPSAQHNQVCEFQLRLDHETGRWHVSMVKLRADKPHPNSIRVVDLTMQNIVEDVKVEELCA
jgi:hypothetical protein